MLINIVGLLILVALVALFAWLARRAWGTRRRFLKWPGVILACLLMVVLALVTVIIVLGFYKLNVAPYSYPVANIKVAGSPEQVARGQKLANTCTGCHSTANALPLDGSKIDFGSEGPPLVGHIQPPNLTPGGPLKDWTDGEVMRAIREGVDKTGRPLVIMPSSIFRNLSDEDAQALVAYLRSQPAVQHEIAPTEPGLLAALFIGTGMFPTSAQPPITAPVVAPAAGVNAEYGKYLVDISGCRDCHGEELAGNAQSAAPNLTTIIPNWSDTHFVSTIRSGIDPSGHTLNADQMPWKAFSAAYSDDELKAMYQYLHSLTPVTTTK